MTLRMRREKQNNITTHTPCHLPSLQRFWRETQLQRRALEDDELRLEEDVSKDGEANAGV